MATRSCIIVKVRNSDVGTTQKYSDEKSKAPANDWGGDGVDLCEDVKIEKPYMGVYCHWDGYPSGVTVIDLATMHDKVPSKSEARKLIKSNGFSVNKVKVGEKDTVNESNLINGKYLLLQKGKKDYCLVTVN